MITALCPDCKSRVCEHIFRPLARPLTPRTKQVLLMLSGGLTNKEIAAELDLTNGTIKVYISRLYGILGVTSRLEASLWARAHKDLLGDWRTHP